MDSPSSVHLIKLVYAAFQAGHKLLFIGLDVGSKFELECISCVGHWFIHDQPNDAIDYEILASIIHHFNMILVKASITREIDQKLRLTGLIKTFKSNLIRITSCSHELTLT